MSAQLSAHDDDGAIELLGAMDAVLNSRAATANDLIAIALSHASPEARRLDLALRRTLRAHGAPLTARAVGQLLRYTGRTVRLANGKRLLSSCYRGHSRLWRIDTK